MSGFAINFTNVYNEFEWLVGATSLFVIPYGAVLGSNIGQKMVTELDLKLEGEYYNKQKKINQHCSK